MILTEKQSSATERVCVYGGPKSGKSLLVGKLAEKYKLIWLDNEQGWGVLRQLPVEWQKNINIISIPDSKTFPIAAETWMKIIKGDKVEVCQDHGKVSCAICRKENKLFEPLELKSTPADTIVVFDSLTQLSQSFIAHITKNQADDYKLEYDDWGNLKVLIEKFLSQVQVAPYNIVCITHEEETEFEDKKKRIVPVSGSSKSSRNTAKYFDHVVYVEVKNKKHVAGSGTDYGMSIVTGSRMGVKLEIKTEPSLLDIFTSWKSGFTGVEKVNRTTLEVEVSKKDELKAALSEKRQEKKLEEKLESISSNIGKTPGQIALENLKAKAAGLVGSGKQ